MVTTAKTPAKKKTKPKKSTLGLSPIPRDFIECLRTYVPGFAAESEAIQWGLASMAWEGEQKRRRHRIEQWAMTFSQVALDEHLGRNKYPAIAKRVSLFARSDSWSKEHQATRHYWFVAEARSALDHYRSLTETDPVDLLRWHGEQMVRVKTLPSAIASIGTSGKKPSTSEWDFVKERLNRVPVDTESLKALLMLLTSWHGDPEFDPTLKPFIPAIINGTVKLLRLSNTTLAGSGYIPQVYAIAPSGRVYGKGLSLQNTMSVVKDAALHGMWEYDFSNCHFVLLGQMAEANGMSCPAINHYLTNKLAVRQRIAEKAGISHDLVKKSLIALIYGARPTLWRKAAIPSLMEPKAVERLIGNPEFKAISDEISGASKAVIDGWPRNKSGGLTNASGRAIRGKGTTNAQKLSHLLQGIEAKALHAVVSCHPDDIVLLQHDGFVSKRRLDCDRLERAVLDATGYRLRLIEKRLQLDSDARKFADSAKSEIAREALPVLGLDDFDVD